MPICNSPYLRPVSFQNKPVYITFRWNSYFLVACNFKIFRTEIEYCIYSNDNSWSKTVLFLRLVKMELFKYGLPIGICQFHRKVYFSTESVITRCKRWSWVIRESLSFKNLHLFNVYVYATANVWSSKDTYRSFSVKFHF